MDQTPVITLASGAPLIDLDLTVVVQFALFLILLFITNKLLFQPYLELRSRRKAGIEGARTEATEMAASAESKLAAYEKQLADARKKANDEARTVRLAAAKHEEEVTAKARASAQTAIDEAQTKMRAETEAARAQLLPQANELAKAIASRLLGREVR